LIQKPFNLSIKNKIIDGTKDYKMSWQTSGDLSNSFSISIYNNTTDALTWSLPRTFSQAMSYTIPANSFPNGVDYKISVTVWSSIEQSATSQFVIFTASSTPVVIADEIGTVGNHTYLFSATYTQAENNPVSKYTVNLYNADKSLIKTSGTLTDGLLEYRFDLLKNDTNYYIEFIVTSKIGLTATSGLVEFTVVYDNPSMYFELTADSIPEKAGIKLNWKIREVIGKTSIISPFYIDGTKIDVRNGKVFYDEGFEISNDFTLKIWFENLMKNVNVIYLKGSNGDIKIQYKSDNKFHIYKKIGNSSYHYSSNEIDSIGIFLCLQQIDGRIDLYTEAIPASVLVSLKNVTFDQLKGTTFDQLSNATF
jgi:hypothetical protein